MSVSERVDVAATLVVVVAAIAMWVSRSSPTGNEDGLPSKINEGSVADSNALHIGPANPDLLLIEYVDFQCPFCARIGPLVDSLLTEFPNELALALVHYPLPTHPEAVAASVAVECAERQSSARAYVRVLWEHQERFASHPWVEVASRAGVPDSVEFAHCVGLPPDSFPRIAAGQRLAAGSSVAATPGLYVEGRRSSGSTLRRDIERVLGRR